jgi:general secretion pathway protein E
MSSIESFLLERGALKPADVERVQRVQSDTGERFVAALRRAGTLHGKDLLAALSAYYGAPIVGEDEWPEAPVLPGAFSLPYLRRAKVLPIAETAEGLVVAVADPGEEDVLEAIRLAAGRPILIKIAAADDIDTAIGRLMEIAATRRAEAEAAVAVEGGGGDNEEDVQQLRDLALGGPVVRYVNELMLEALRLRATDIHIEPWRAQVQVRMRIDGMLRQMRSPPQEVARFVVSRIKILSGLDIAERRLPQDGRARVKIEGRQLDMRVATAPTINGEAVVIRLLDNLQRTLELARLGFAPAEEKTVRRHLAAPHGMILVTGPTGSGKTTTLAAALTILNEPHRKILSIEDPVEYQIDGINQTPVRPEIGVTFAHVLRSFLRHDPDVIMVGELRDGETASTAVQAALTGHLVLSTLHTNTAAGAVTRLQDMGVESFLLASALHCVVGQRLVRLLCPACKESYRGRPDIPDELLARSGIAAGEQIELWRPVGCDRCNGAGFAGRTTIVEVLEVKHVKHLIRPGIATQEIAAAAVAAGMHTMMEDGLAKCRAGLTTPDEVMRVALDAD